MSKPFYVYVDVDETFVRNYGTKRIPIPETISHIKALHHQSAVMYYWSSGGAEYAKASAKEFGIDACFTGFLPEPELVIDDMPFSQWRNLLQIHPNECSGHTIASYKEITIKN